MNWQDFNTADNQNTYELIPATTPIKVRMTLKPGGYNDPQKGWTGGYATRNALSGSIYLNAEFIVLSGPYARRKIWSLIGLHSEKSDEWANIGRSMINAILNSARGVRCEDHSQEATSARRINGLEDLDGIEFLARADIEKDQYGNSKNVIKHAITFEHKDYARLMGQGSYAAVPKTIAHQSSSNLTSSNLAENMPAWAR